MKKKLQHLTTQSLYTVLLLAAVAVLATALTLAAYTNQGYKKGVATSTKVDIPFSSDLLLQVGQTEAADTYSDFYQDFTPNAAEPAQNLAINIYNYVPNTPAKISTNDITYTLRVTVNAPSGYTPAAGYQLDGAAFTASAASAAITLPRNVSAAHQHTITIPYKDIGQVTLTVTATPDVASSNALGNKMLARLIRTRFHSDSTDAANVWSGLLTDRPGSTAAAPTAAPSGFDAFNYEISGIGKGSVTLAWPVDKLEIDPYFLADTTVHFTDKTAPGQITFTVDAAEWNYRSIQFYRKASPSSGETWDQWQTAGTGITFTFTPTTATQ